MSESAATAWIIDRLEIENTKMEEDMGTMESCEEDSNGGNSGGSIWHYGKATAASPKSTHKHK